MSSSMRHPSKAQRLLSRLGEYCWDRPLRVLGSWLIATIAAGLIAGGYADNLVSGAGSIAGSQSARVDTDLTNSFGIRDRQSLILTYSSPELNGDAGANDAFVEALEDGLYELPVVETVLLASDLVELPRDDEGHALIIALDTKDALAAEQQVPVIRTAVRATLTDYPDVKWAVTGRSAIGYDLAIFSAQDSMASELRAVPLALLVLVFAFGAALSAALPIALAVAARTVAFAGVVLLAGLFEVSTVSQAIVSMLAIALGIDYSLFVYHRYRQILCDAGGDCVEEIDAKRRDALVEAMGQSGIVVLYSGIAVAIGMTSLVMTPMMEMRSIGLGGLVAVVVSVAVALTMLPALLSLIGAKALDWPNLAKPGRGYEATSAGWSNLGRRVVARPWIAIWTSLVVLLLMAAPSIYTQSGFPDDEFFPGELESVRGVKMLGDMEIKGFSAPVFVVLTRDDGSKVITAQNAKVLRDWKEVIEADPRIAEVATPRLSARASLMPFPVASAQKLISDNGDKILFRLIPRSETSLYDLRSLVREIPGWVQLDGVRVETGGQAQFLNDFDDGVTNSYAAVILTVLIATGIALYLMLGAPLASFKALMLNLLSVAAGYGMVVFVFQLGYGAWIFGVSGPTQLIPSSVPVVIFAILFGLSMDYEIFLVSRMKDIYLRCGDNERSIVEALGDTGSVISSAALIMALVFGAFAFSQIIIVQMVGLGLAVAILVDALIIRGVLGPALMMVAGKWNWWPLIPDTARE
ncbi:MAG: MMPL family transporter [Pseudomonadota bacterium]